MHVSVPAVTKAIANLESELGITLLDRSNYRVCLNTYGKQLVKHAHSIMTEVEEAKRSLRRIQEQTENQLHINVAPALMPELIPQAIIQLRKTFPDAIVDFSGYEPGRPDGGLTGLANGKFDLLIYPITKATDLSDFTWQPLARMTLRIVTAKNHPANTLKHPTLQQLRDYEWLIPSPVGPPFEAVKEMFYEHGAELPATLQSAPTRVMATRMLEDGQYIAALPCNDKLFQLDKERFTILDIDSSRYGWTHYILQRKTSVPRPVLEHFVSTLRDIMGTGDDHSKALDP